MHISRLRGERGSISLFAVIITLAAFILLGLVVDGSGRLHAQQRAQAVAREAARQAGQEIQAPAAIRGNGAHADVAAARNAAQRYLSTAGVSGTVEIRSATTVVVSTRTTYNPIFLSIIGIGTLSADGRAEARLADGILP